MAKEYHLDNRFHLIHFLNGTSAILLEDYTTAKDEFSKAVTLYPSDHPEKGDWTAHLGDAIYRLGEKEKGKKIILEGVQFINDRSDQIDSFLLSVWTSGAYLRLAKLLERDDIDESKFYLSKAKEIINSDNRLVIRKQQLESYLESVKSS